MSSLNTNERYQARLRVIRSLAIALNGAIEQAYQASLDSEESRDSLDEARERLTAWAYLQGALHAHKVTCEILNNAALRENVG